MIYTMDEIRPLVDRYGSPFYLFDEQGFVDNYHSLEQSLSNIYGNYHIAYSFKTNYTPYIANVVRQLGGYAEVVSGMEYDIARRIGYENSKIVFNGPVKGTAGETAFLNGCMVNVDSLDELHRYCRLAAAYPSQRFKLGVRINLNIGQDFISRFGIEETELPEAFRTVANTGNVTINGLHCHISRCRGLDAWRRRAEIMLRLAAEYFEDVPEYIDLGSGMFGTMEPEFAAQFDNIPTYADYAEAVARQFVREYPNGSRQPMLLTEPGTTLINRFIDCYSKIEAIKSIRGKVFAMLDCSYHTLGETCTLKQLPMQIIPSGMEQTDYTNVDFTGYTCLEQDLMRQHYNGALAVGDYVRFGNVGGYSNVLKPPFIRPNCAMLARKPDGSVQLLKHAEDFNDLLHTYEF